MAALDPASRGSETILLVEDSHEVRAFAGEALRAHGYTILEAGNVEEALRILGGHPGPVHVLVTDIVLPEISGADLAQQLVAAQPDLRVLYTSGYPRDVIEPGSAFLQKPYKAQDLARKVREVLDSEARSPERHPG